MKFLPAVAVLATSLSLATTAHASSRFLFTQPNASATASISFGATDLDVTGISPGSAVALFAVGLTPHGFDSTVSRWATVVEDTARQSAIHFDAGQPIPWKSIWVAVELPTMKYSISAPNGYGIHARSRGLRRLKRGPSNHIDRVRIAGSFADVLYVAPDGECWSIEARDGYDTDSDGVVDGFTTVALGRFRPLTASPPPTDFSSGGLLFIVDFLRMVITPLPVNADLLNEAE